MTRYSFERRLLLSAVFALIVLLLSSLPTYAQARNTPARTTGSPAPARTAGNTTPTPQPRDRDENREVSRVEEALSTFFGVLARRPAGDSGPRQADALYQKGLELERSGRMVDAIRTYDEALKLSYEDPRIHLAIGRMIEAENPALSLYHYQSAFRYAIEASQEQVPALEMLRRFLVGRYIQYALPIENAPVSIKLLELALALAPEDPRLHAHLGTAYFFGGQYDRSIQESRNAITLGLDDGLIYTNIAAAYAQMRKPVEAESYLVMALNRDEADINGVLNAIREASASDTLVTFKTLLGQDRLQRIMDNSAKGLVEAALVKWRQGDTMAAVELAKKATQSHPRLSFPYIVLGDLKRATGCTACAREAYTAALERNPQNELAYPRLGDLTFADRDYVAAANYYRKAMDLMGGRMERPEYVERTAVALAQQRKFDDALALLDRWLKENGEAPEYYKLSLTRAGILADASRTREAEVILKGLIERDRSNPAGYISVYNYYLERGEDRKARSTINDGIIRLQEIRDRDPLNPAPYVSISRLYRVLGNDIDAKKSLLAGGLRTVEKRYFSNALFAMDAETEAFDVLKAWIAAEPRNPEALLSYGWVAAKLGRELPAALAKVEEVGQMFGATDDLSPVRRTRGYLRFAMKEYEKAIEDIRAVLTSDEVSEAAFFHRLWGASAEALNRRAEAIEHYTRALRLDGDANADLQERLTQLGAAPAAGAGTNR